MINISNKIATLVMMTCDYVLIQQLTLSNFVYKISHTRLGSAPGMIFTHFVMHSGIISAGWYYLKVLDKLTRVRFEHGSHGWNENVLTYNSHVPPPPISIFTYTDYYKTINWTAPPIHMHKYWKMFICAIS